MNALAVNWESIFWAFFFIMLASYGIYPLLMWLLSMLIKPRQKSLASWPEVTLVIAAYNEKDIIEDKIANTDHLSYPKDRLKVYWVTDGSDDGSDQILKKFPQVSVYHEPQRNGKVGAINRVMKFVDTPITVFCDANSALNRDCIERLVESLSMDKVGCVAGEKRIVQHSSEGAASAGEGFYWKVESGIKQAESDIYSTVGAAGELFAIKTGLFKQIPADSIIEDFVLSMNIAAQGYRVKYEKDAYSSETASENIEEELKRKTRIAYGSIQTLFRYPSFLNPFRMGFLSLQYLFHKVFRWSVVPLGLPIILMASIFLALEQDASLFYGLFVLLESIFILFVILGYLFKNKSLRPKIIYVPYYFLFMNLAIIKGYFRYFTSTQSVNWDKAKRTV